MELLNILLTDSYSYEKKKEKKVIVLGLGVPSRLMKKEGLS